MSTIAFISSVSLGKGSSGLTATAAAYTFSGSSAPAVDSGATVGTVYELQSGGSGTGSYCCLVTYPAADLAAAVPAVLYTIGGLPYIDWTPVPVAGPIAASVAGNVAGSVGSVAGNVGGSVAGSVGSVAGAVGSVTAPVSLNLAQAVPVSNTAQTVGDSLNAARVQGFGGWSWTAGGANTSTLTLLNSDGSVARTFTINAPLPTGGGVPTSRT